MLWVVTRENRDSFTTQKNRPPVSHSGVMMEIRKRGGMNIVEVEGFIVLLGVDT